MSSALNWKTLTEGDIRLRKINSLPQGCFMNSQDVFNHLGLIKGCLTKDNGVIREE